MQARKRFRENLRQAMAIQGISQRELASMVGGSYPHVNRILQGHCDLTMDRAEDLATAVGVSMPDMFLPSSKFQALLDSKRSILS